MTKQYATEQIIPILEQHIDRKPRPHDCLRVNHVALDVMGHNNHTKVRIPSALSDQIRDLAAERGWYPDPNDQTRAANTRLYKGGKP